jgi:hypothetical protein
LTEYRFENDMITSRKTASSKFIETLLGRKRLRVLLGVLVSHCLVVAGSLHAVEVSVVAFQGDRIVGLDEDETLAQWDLPFGINHRGEVAFSGLVHQTASNGDVQQAGKGIWMGRPGEIKLLARNGQQAPGFDEGMVFSALFLSTIEVRSRSSPGLAQHGRTRKR